MPAPLALARLAVTLAQAPRDGADQGLHLLDLPAFEPGERRVAQDFVTQAFRFLARIVVAGREPLGILRTCGRQCVQIVAQLRNAELIEDACREDPALGKIAD